MRAALGERVPYDGRQLRPHFLHERFGVVGDAAVAFRGPCDVRGTALVDLEDRRAGARICSPDMLHVMLEVFGADLVRTVILQRLLVCLAAEVLRGLLGPAAAPGLFRRGDDLYAEGGKLSVSVATVSPVSGLIHLGLNIDGSGAPVRTADLAGLGVAPDAVAQGLLELLATEMDQMVLAMCKVAPAHGPEGGS